MRLFVAIELSEEVRRHLVKVQDQLRAGAGRVSWTKMDNLHLTLKFLGEVADPDVPGVCDALKTVTGGRGLQLSAAGMECFPERGAIRVVGARMDGSIDGLREVVEQIETVCQEIGFRREGRAYRPHVTLARAREPLPALRRQQFAEATARHWPGPVTRVERFALIQSRLDAKGAEYTPIAHFPLTGT